MNSIGVIIPNYNKADVICKTIKSVKNQSVPFDEVVIVDDGSTDSSATVISSYATDDITFIRQSNSGVAKARNNGLKHITSDWVVFLDSDDIIDKDYVKTVKEFVQSSADNCQIIVCGWKQEDDNGHAQHIQTSVASSDWLHHCLTYGLAPIHAVIVKVDCLPRENPFNDKLPAMEDTEFFIRRILDGLVIRSIPSVLATYVQYPGSRGKNAENVEVANLYLRVWALSRHLVCIQCFRATVKLVAMAPLQNILPAIRLMDSTSKIVMAFIVFWGMLAKLWIRR